MSTQEGTLVPVHHPTLFAEFKVFLVENTLFKVPIDRIIENSVFFSDLLSLPAPDINGIREGDVEDLPIRIAHESAATFARVLEWLYPKPSQSSKDPSSDLARMAQPNGEHSPLDLTDPEVAGLVELLRFADKFQMQALSDTSLGHLSRMKLQPAAKIVICERFDVDLEWAADAFLELCIRWIPPDISELKDLSGRSCAIIMERRDLWLKEAAIVFKKRPATLECKRCPHAFHPELGDPENRMTCSSHQGLDEKRLKYPRSMDSIVSMFSWERRDQDSLQDEMKRHLRQYSADSDDISVTDSNATREGF